MQKLTALLLIIGFVTPHLAGAATVHYFDINDSGFGEPIPTGYQWIPPSLSAPSLSLSNEPSATPAQLAAAQKETWQAIDQDTDPCKPTPSRRSLSLSLNKVIRRGLQKNLSQLIGKTINQNLEKIVHRQIGQVLPRVIEDGLKQRLPNLLQERMRSGGRLAGERPSAEMLRQAVTELLPQIIQQDFPGQLRESLTGALTSNLTGQFEDFISTTTTGAEFGTRRSELLEGDRIFLELVKISFGPFSALADLFMRQIPNLVKEIIEKNIEDAVNAALIGNLESVPKPNQVINQLRLAVTEQITLSFQAMIENLGTNILSGIAEMARGGVAQSGGVDQLVQRMMPMIMRMVQGGIPGSTFGGINGSSGLGNQDFSSGAVDDSGFDFNEWAGNDIFAAAGFDLRPLSEALATPVALSLVSGVGFSGYDRAVTNLATLGFDGQITPQIIGAANGLGENGANYLAALGPDAPSLSQLMQTSGGIDAAANGDLGANFDLYPSPIAPEFRPPAYADISVDLPPGTVGPPQPLNTIADSAVKAVDPNTIAENGMNFGELGSQIGAELKSAMVGSISGAVGNLVEGVPYAGGFLAPIASKVVELALIAVLGPIALLISGVPVHDDAVPKTVSDTGKAEIKALIKPLYKIEEKEEQQVKQNTAIIKNQATEITATELACQQMRQAKEAIRTLEKRKLDDAAAAAAAARGQATAAERFRQWTRKAIPDRFDPNNEAGAMNINGDFRRDPADAAKEALLQFANSIDDPRDPMAINLTDMAYGRSEPQNESDPLSLDFARLDKATNLAMAAAEAEKLELIANGGVRSIKECPAGKMTADRGGGQFCSVARVVRTPGSTLAARNNAFATADINRANQTSAYKQNEFLDDLNYYFEQYVANSGGAPSERPDFALSPGLDPYYGSSNRDGYAVAGAGQNAGGRPTFNDVFAAEIPDVINGFFDQASGSLPSDAGDLIGALESSFRDSDAEFMVGRECDFGCQANLGDIIADAFARIQYVGDDVLEAIIRLFVELIQRGPARAPQP